MPTRLEAAAAGLLLAAVVAVAVGGCGGEPSEREVGNARVFEALLTAVSLKDRAELERDARRIDERHGAGELSAARYRELREVVETARAGDWGGAERRAYEFRKPFGDGGAYFK